MTRFRRARLLVLFLLASCAQASPLAPGMKAVEEIRGRKFIKDVRNVTIDRSDLQKHLREQMAKSIPYSLGDWGAMLRFLQHQAARLLELGGGAQVAFRADEASIRTARGGFAETVAAVAAIAAGEEAFVHGQLGVIAAEGGHDAVRSAKMPPAAPFFCILLVLYG